MLIGLHLLQLSIHFLSGFHKYILSNMMKNKLTALHHPTPDAMDFNDRKVFASTVLWLEDQKIREYRIEDRAGLRQVDALDRWEKAYAAYKQDIGMPKVGTPTEEMSWLLSYAVRLEFLDDPSKYKSIDAKQMLEKTAKAQEPTVKAQNSFDKLDFNHKDFISGVRTLANKLGIANHPDHLVLLEAVKRVVHDRLSPQAAKIPVVEGKPFPFETGNDVITDEQCLDIAARILRLLQIHNLRELQTKINETIVAVQDLTADPRTDTKLGKVGF